MPFGRQVAAKCLETGVYGAYWNVMTNLDKFDNDEDRKQVSCVIIAGIMCNYRSLRKLSTSRNNSWCSSK